MKSLKDITGSFQEYKKQAAIYIRHREADFARGQVDRLNFIDQCTDEELLKKWSWVLTIFCAVFSFFIFPIFMAVLSSFLPHVIMIFLEALLKVCMAITMIMFGAAMYFTMIKE